MEVNTLVRFLHIIFGALLLGQTLEDWLLARAWAGESRQNILTQYRRQIRDEPRKAAVLFGALVSGIILVFVRLNGAFSGWIWLSIALVAAVMILAVLLETRSRGETFKRLEADPTRGDFVDVQAGMSRSKLFYGLALLAWLVITLLMVFQPF